MTQKEITRTGGIIILRMTPKDTPETIKGKKIVDKFTSMRVPFPFFKGCGLQELDKNLIAALTHILIFDRAIAFFASNLKNAWLIGTTRPAPPIPPILVIQTIIITIIIPQNSDSFIGNTYLCLHYPYY